MTVTSLIRAGEQTRYISLDVAHVAAGSPVGVDPGDERLVVILTGRARLVIDGVEHGIVGSRADVFDGRGDAVYLPPASAASFASIDDNEASLAIVTAPASSLPAGEARVIAATDQPESVVGRDNWSRTVRSILGPDDAASRLLVGETLLVGTGTWSSFPPHRHDRESADEVQLEEVYYYRVQPANGFAVQVRYETDGGIEDLRMARDGEAVAITSGFHPVVAAPGHDLYYLWILAGEQRAMRVHLDPRYRWLNEVAGQP